MSHHPALAAVLPLRAAFDAPFEFDPFDATRPPGGAVATSLAELAGAADRGLAAGDAAPRDDESACLLAFFAGAGGVATSGEIASRLRGPAGPARAALHELIRGRRIVSFPHRG